MGLASRRALATGVGVAAASAAAIVVEGQAAMLEELEKERDRRATREVELAERCLSRW